MNQTIAQVLGTVLAGSRIGEQTVATARQTLGTALGETASMDLVDKFQLHGEAVLRFATDTGVVDAVLAAATAHEAALTTARHALLGDTATNATALFRWLGMLHGALIVSWAQVRGAAEAMDAGDLLTLAEEGVNWNYDMLESAESELESRGQDAATTYPSQLF